MAKIPLAYVVTANLTDDGSVAYMRADQSWTPTLSDAAVVESDAVVQEMLQAAAQQERIVCDAYAMKVHKTPEGPVALSARERIREQGPTTRLRRPDPLMATEGT